MKIQRSKKMERKVLDKIKEHLSRAPRSLDKWHVSDLLYPRKSYFGRVDPQPMTDMQAMYFTAGRAHHEIIEAMLGPKRKWKFGDLMFLAGLVEGEGHFHVDSRDGNVSLCVDNTKKSLIDWCHSRFGGYNNQVKQAKEHEQASYRWTAKADLAEEIVRAIHPFLVSKRNQADLWLELRERIGKKSTFKKLPALELAARQKLIEKLQAARRIDGNTAQLQTTTDSGEFEKHGIYYSPDMRWPFPVEIKTSRAQYEPKSNYEKKFEGYLHQLNQYQALMEDDRGILLMFYLGLKQAGQYGLKPAFRVYKVVMSAAERAKKLKWMIGMRDLLSHAVKTKKHDKLPLCPQFMCGDCPWFKKCAPWKIDSKRKELQK